MRGFVKTGLSSILYFFGVAVFASPSVAFGGLAALIIHECGHLLAAFCLHEPIESIEFTPFGGVIRQKERNGSGGFHGAAVAFAGPLANLLAILLFIKLLPQLNTPQIVTLRPFITSNCGMFFLNLLPALPMDGGEITFHLGSSWLCTGTLIRALSYSGCSVGILLCVTGIAGMVLYGVLNISLLIVGLYMIFKAGECGRQLLCDQYYCIINDLNFPDVQHPCPLKLFCVGANTRLISLVPLLSEKRRTAFLYDGQPEDIMISDRAVCATLKRFGSMATIRNIIEMQNLS